MHGSLGRCITCDDYLGEAKCEAFPHRIPAALFTNERIHNFPSPDDGGLRYASPRGDCALLEEADGDSEDRDC